MKNITRSQAHIAAGARLSTAMPLESGGAILRIIQSLAFAIASLVPSVTQAQIFTAPNGSIGIGTTNPGSLLELSGVNASLTIHASDGFPGLNFKRGNGSEWNFYTHYLNSFADDFIISHSSETDAQPRIRLPSNTRDVLLALSGGNVGIGTTSPRKSLDVAGDISYSGRLSHLDTEEANVARVRTVALLFGSGTQRRALVDTSDGLQLNYASDWPQLVLGGQRVIVAGPIEARQSLDVIGNAGVRGKLTCQILEVTSDRNAKTKFASLNRSEVLDKLLGLEISAWEYTNAPGVRHYGAMAQDFHAKFGVGSDDKHINPLDAASVALLGVQALAAQVQQRDERLAAKEAEIASLQREVVALKKDMLTQRDLAGRIAKLEKLVAGIGNATTNPQASSTSPADSASLAAE